MPCRCGRRLVGGRRLCKQCSLDDYWSERAKAELDDEDLPSILRDDDEEDAE